MKKILHFKLPKWGKTALIIALIAGFFGGGLMLFWLATLPIPDFDSFDERLVSESTKIYDRTGEVVLYDVYGDAKRTVVPFEEISKEIKNATVAIEDSEFYEHRGVKPIAILRALIVNILAGAKVQGGSTISQQVIKNALLTTDKTWTRKIKEAILALKMERVLTKEQILSIYLNESPYGGTMYGVEEASQAFFGKPAKDVNLAEAAYLAAIPKAPTYYSPFGQNVDKLEERKNLVLRRMSEIGFITPEQEEAAKRLKVDFQRPTGGNIKAPHFVLYVRELLEQEFGEEAVRTRGYKVITTLDWELQQKAESIVADYAAENLKNFNASNAALVAIDPKTGNILTMVGSKDYFSEDIDGNFNIATAKRQPGSTFKPFAYAEAINKGFTSETIVFDVPTQFDTACSRNPDRCYRPSNYDDQFRGPMTFRSALAQSINIPAIKVLYLAGIRDTLNLAKQMGIETLDDYRRYGLTLVLGGGEVTLLDLTSAYSVFANDGVRNPHNAIIRVEDRTGEVLLEYATSSQSVLKPDTARIISDILSDNVARQPSYAANSPLSIPGYQVAAKTGTTNDFRDTWIVGYTPSIAVGAWAGNNDNSPIEKRVAGLVIAPMWNAFMREALGVMPNESFVPPEPINPSLPPYYRGFWQGGQNYFVDKASGKLATEYTPEDMREERVITSIHSILHWLGRTDDAQYPLWEEPVRAWAATHGYVDGNESVIPRDYDDVHTAANRPRFNVAEPRANYEYPVDERVTVRISNYRGAYPLDSVDVFLNDTFLGSAKQEPFEFSFIPAELDEVDSRNELKVIIYDTMRNRNEETIRLEIDD